MKAPKKPSNINNKKLEKYLSTQTKKPSIRFISKYQRLYLMDKDENIDNNINNYKKHKKDKHFSLKHVFDKPKDPFGGEKHWPKITHPQLPFKNRNRPSKEEIKQKLITEKPSHIIRDFYTIKWLRKKYSDSVIEKSVCKLLPNKKENITISGEKEIEKRHREMLEYLNSFKGPIGREKYVDINPKYFFSETTFKKILKLRDIFMEFDPNQRGSKMAFNEILYKFNENNIKAEPEDIVNLFFKDKQIKKKEDFKKLYLDFYQFIKFALEKDQEFREFMRKIKRKYLREKRLKNKNEFFFDNDKNNNIYLPMNFNLVLDYFINKGKERESIQKVQTAIHEMDKAIREKEKYMEKHSTIVGKQSSKYLNFKKSNLEKINIRNLKSRSLSNKKMDLHKMSKYYIGDMTINEKGEKNQKDKVLTDINVGELFKEVFTLFSLNNKTTTNKKNFKDNFSFENSENKLKNDNNSEDDEMIDLIIEQINKNTLKKMTMDNFHRYHDLRLTVSMTKEQINMQNKNFEKLVKGNMSFDNENKNNLRVSFEDNRRLYSRNNILNKKEYIIGRFRSINQSVGKKDIRNGIIGSDMLISPIGKNFKLDFVPQEFLSPKNSKILV